MDSHTPDCKPDLTFTPRIAENGEIYIDVSDGETVRVLDLSQNEDISEFYELCGNQADDILTKAEALKADHYRLPPDDTFYGTYRTARPTVQEEPEQGEEPEIRICECMEL